jgi:hypothetical protein
LSHIPIVECTPTYDEDDETIGTQVRLPREGLLGFGTGMVGFHRILQWRTLKNQLWFFKVSPSYKVLMYVKCNGDNLKWLIVYFYKDISLVNLFYIIK